MKSLSDYNTGPRRRKIVKELKKYGVLDRTKTSIAFDQRLAFEISRHQNLLPQRRPASQEPQKKLGLAASRKLLDGRAAKHPQW